MTTQSMPAPQDAAAPLTLHRAPLPALTGIRFFAAMQVVMFHFGASFAQRHGAPPVVENLLKNGWTAVTLFFILSGFILSYTYSGQITRPGGKMRFWEARFARIYPVYFLSLILSLPFRGHPGAGLTIAALFMVQAWNPFHVDYAGVWNMPAWTLSTEAFFYLFFPFVLPFLEKSSTRILKTLAVGTVLLIALGHTMTHAIEPLTRLTGFPLPAFRFPEFFAGMLLGLIFLRGERRLRPSLLLYPAVIASLVILALVKGPWVSLVAIPSTILIFELAVAGTWLAWLLGNKEFLLLGGASYAIYLLQWPVRSWVHFAVTGSTDFNTAKGGLDTFLSPIILVLFSIGVFLLWEEPMRKWLRSWFKKHSGRKLSSV